jgi:hypothetical protein
MNDSDAQDAIINEAEEEESVDLSRSVNIIEEVKNFKKILSEKGIEVKISLNLILFTKYICAVNFRASSTNAMAFLCQY